MKSLRIAVLLLICLGGFWELAAQSRDGYTDLVEKVMPSIVLVTAFDGSGKTLRRGTGFCVAANTFITNHHVIEGATRITVRTSRERSFVARAESSSIASDVALLKTDEISEIRPLEFASSLPKPGERVVVVGNPLGLTGSVSDGIVSAVRESDRLVQITAPISPGSSGSPVFNLRGDVIGVATLNVKGGQSLNFAVSGVHIRSLWPQILRNARISTELTLSSRWRLLDDEETVYDKQSLAKVGNIISVWIRHTEKDGTYSKNLHEIDCGSRKLRLVQFTSYDARGGVEQSSSAPQEWAAVVPDSKGETFYEVFCDGKPDLQSGIEINQLIELGQSHEKAGNIAQAVDTYWKALRLADKRVDERLFDAFTLRDDLERIYKEQRDIGGLEKFYKYQLERGSVTAYSDLASAYKEIGSQDKFRATLLSGIRRFEERTGSAQAKSSDFVELAKFFELQNQDQKALMVLLTGRKRFPDDSSLVMSLGQLYLRTNRADDCITLINAFLPSLKGRAQRQVFLAFLREAYLRIGDEVNADRVDRELRSN